MPHLTIYERIPYGYLLTAKVATVLAAFTTIANLVQGRSLPWISIGCMLGLYYIAYRAGASRFGGR